MNPTDYQLRSPEYAQYYYKQAAEDNQRAYDQQQRAELAKWAKTSGYLGNEAVDYTGMPTTPGTGIYAEGFNPQQRDMMLGNRALLMSGHDAAQTQGLSQMGSMQDSRNTGVNQINMEKWKKDNIPRKADTKLGQLFELKASMDPSDPRMAAVNSAITKESTHSKLLDVNVNGGKPLPYKLPEGMMLKDVNNPQLGVTPIPGAKTEKTSVSDASKIESMRLAQAQIPLIEQIMFRVDEDGNATSNDLNILAADFNVPFSDGRTASSLYEQGIQAITRAETGAAMPPSDLANTRARFQPNSLDSPELKLAKWQSFQLFLNGTLKLIDPDGNFMTSRFSNTLRQMESDNKKGIVARQTSSNGSSYTRDSSGKWTLEK